MKSPDLMQEAKRNHQQGILKQEGRWIQTEDESGACVRDRLERGVMSFSGQEGGGQTA